MRESLYTIRGFKLAFAFAHLMPRSSCQWLAPRIGLAAYRRSAEAQAALRANLRAVTGLEGVALDALCAKNVVNFSRMLADYFLCAGPDAAEQAARLLSQHNGGENLAAARALGRGIIVVTGHLGHWELGGHMLTRLGSTLR